MIPPCSLHIQTGSHMHSTDYVRSTTPGCAPAANGRISVRDTLRAMRQDIRRYGRADELTLGIALRNLYTHPSLANVLYYRLGQWLWQRRKFPLVWPFVLLYRIGYLFVRLYGGVELSPRASIGPGLCILHMGPTIINPETVAGMNLTVHHGVTIGAAKTGVPSIGDNVSIGVGAVVLGGVTVGSNVIIGARAVVTKDLPSNCVAVGIPAVPVGSMQGADGRGFVSEL